ncbi:hypothetical protein [Halorarius litoreus]|uniref:hypothetical protein n=1 Tax=Halorarius litoreus TaxID=2962676 RepID=UPI0020CF4127|nr:hypothetical protein [Halorarius litoreus]
MSNEPAHPDAPTREIPADPETLFDDPAVDTETQTKEIDADDFDDLRAELTAVDGWVVVGLTNEAGALLLMDDGTHGWTLPAVSVRDGDWADRAHEVVDGLTGWTSDLETVERVRRIDYHEDGGDGRVTVHHVVVRAEPVTGDPVAAEPTVGCDGTAEVDWVDALPSDVEGVVRDDAALFR